MTKEAKEGSLKPAYSTVTPPHCRLIPEKKWVLMSEWHFQRVRQTNCRKQSHWIQHQTGEGGSPTIHFLSLISIAVTEDGPSFPQPHPQTAPEVLLGPIRRIIPSLTRVKSALTPVSHDCSSPKHNTLSSHDVTTCVWLKDTVLLKCSIGLMSCLFALNFFFKCITWSRALYLEQFIWVLLLLPTDVAIIAPF